MISSIVGASVALAICWHAGPPTPDESALLALGKSMDLSQPVLIQRIYTSGVSWDYLVGPADGRSPTLRLSPYWGQGPRRGLMGVPGAHIDVIGPVARARRGAGGSARVRAVATAMARAFPLGGFAPRIISVTDNAKGYRVWFSEVPETVMGDEVAIVSWDFHVESISHPSNRIPLIEFTTRAARRRSGQRGRNGM